MWETAVGGKISQIQNQKSCSPFPLPVALVSNQSGLCWQGNMNRKPEFNPLLAERLLGIIRSTRQYMEGNTDHSVISLLETFKGSVLASWQPKCQSLFIPPPNPYYTRSPKKEWEEQQALKALGTRSNTQQSQRKTFVLARLGSGC